MLFPVCSSPPHPTNTDLYVVSLASFRSGLCVHEGDCGRLFIKADRQTDGEGKGISRDRRREVEDVLKQEGRQTNGEGKGKCRDRRREVKDV